MHQHASYQILQNIEGSTLLIKDTGDHTKQLTITNDAEHVVRELYLTNYLVNGQHLYVIDSENEINEFNHANGLFIGYSPE